MTLYSAALERINNQDKVARLNFRKMKCTLFTVLIANALIILSLNSCTKNSQSYPVIFDWPQYPVTIDNLAAGRWIKNDRGHYVSTLPGVLSKIKTSNHVKKIYLVANGKETLINRSISYINGTLWAGITNKDLRLDFLPSNNILPFSYLVIKIVIL